MPMDIGQQCQWTRDYSANGLETETINSPFIETANSPFIETVNSLFIVTVNRLFIETVNSLLLHLVCSKGRMLADRRRERIPAGCPHALPLMLQFQCRNSRSASTPSDVRAEWLSVRGISFWAIRGGIREKCKFGSF